MNRFGNSSIGSFELCVPQWLNFRKIQVIKDSCHGNAGPRKKRLNEKIFYQCWRLRFIGKNPWNDVRWIMPIIFFINYLDKLLDILCLQINHLVRNIMKVISMYIISDQDLDVRCVLGAWDNAYITFMILFTKME